MKLELVLITTTCVLSIVAFSLAETKAGAKPESSPATKAAEPPAKPTLVATVGQANIMSDQVEKAMSSLPPEIIAAEPAKVRQAIVDRLVLDELITAYLDAKNVPCDEQELKQIKAEVAAAAANMKTTPEDFMAKAGLTEEKLKRQARVQGLLKATAGDEQVKTFAKVNPGYFNGTKVQASHILIAVRPVASTAQQKAAMAKINELVADIKAGKVTFEKAAAEHSACPSKAKGGDLGEFTFERMVPPFAMAAFNMKVGETSGVVRTQFGFHLIKATGRTEGKSEPDENATQIARAALMAQLENSLLDQALTTCPIVINEQQTPAAK